MIVLVERISDFGTQESQPSFVRLYSMCFEFQFMIYTTNKDHLNAIRSLLRTNDPIIEVQIDRRSSLICTSVATAAAKATSSPSFRPDFSIKAFPFCPPLPQTNQSTLSRTRSRTPRSLRRTSLEPIFELARYFFHRAHAAGAGGLSPLGFHAPIICGKMY